MSAMICLVTSVLIVVFSTGALAQNVWENWGNTGGRQAQQVAANLSSSWQPNLNVSLPLPFAPQPQTSQCRDADQCWMNLNCESCVQYDSSGLISLNRNSQQCQTLLRDYPELEQMIQCEATKNKAMTSDYIEQCEIDKRFALCKDPRSPNASIDCTRRSGLNGPIPIPPITGFQFAGRFRRAVDRLADIETENRIKRQMSNWTAPAGNLSVIFQYSDSCQRVKNNQCQRLARQCYTNNDPCEARRLQEQDALNQKRTQITKDAERRYQDCMDQLEAAIVARSLAVQRNG